ncbi:hypothetical protein CC1G_13580 [Coprinopsis cinerea okayama7|uniref:Uncharacterized protein n=1 Tax=Coprinopsis cinerea (strain Okayama-7 / 130 / ATCC MYA-4618 / FGSC 9003) TaxID=240176 RepID=D6RJS2_COPC7|nr:hypothetical protein CC1G_13580 [Coprinopsis cinerea okayama7\|eukprot:XP_002912052.1 hypothetical protein CC1G_13580 [Coprinopsis cinerea okayama7\
MSTPSTSIHLRKGLSLQIEIIASSVPPSSNSNLSGPCNPIPSSRFEVPNTHSRSPEAKHKKVRKGGIFKSQWAKQEKAKGKGSRDDD